MKLHSIPLNEEGVYLFKTPAKITAQINRELLVVIASPSSKSCGAVFYLHDSSPKELPALLNALHVKVCGSAKVRSEHLRIKLFGMSTFNPLLHDCVLHWAKEKRVEVAAQDIGRNVARHVSIECETGRVGVTYAEAFVPPSRTWLSFGSAHFRNPAPTNDVVLILSQNTVNRQLGRQAVEDFPGWQALSTERPFDWVTGAHDDLFPARALLFFDDMGKGKPIEKWMSNFRKTHPEVRILWVGNKPPRYARGLQLLPPLKPQSLGKFKKYLKGELAKIVNPNSGTSDVIPFPVKAKQKRK